MTNQKSLDDLLTSHGLEVVKKNGLTYAVADSGVFCVHPVEGDYCYIPTEDTSSAVQTLERYVESKEIVAGTNVGCVVWGGVLVASILCATAVYGFYGGKVSSRYPLASLVPVVAGLTELYKYRRAKSQEREANHALKKLFNSAKKGHEFYEQLEKARPTPKD